MVRISRSQARIIVLIITVLVVMFGAYIYRLSLFRITWSYPKDGDTFANSSLDLYFTFNRELVSNNRTKVRLTNTVTGKDISTKNTISQNNLYLTIDQPLVKDATYRVEIKDLYSTKNEAFSTNITFKVEYVDFDKLPPIEQKKQTERSTYYGVNEFEGILPYRTDNYDITVVPAQQGVDVGTIKIDVKHNFREVINGNLIINNIDDYYAKLRKYRTEALNYLKEKKVDIDKYIIQYEEAELRDEFPQGGGIDLE